jgi:hypothetical protein
VSSGSLYLEFVTTRKVSIKSGLCRQEDKNLLQISTTSISLGLLILKGSHDFNTIHMNLK